MKWSPEQDAALVSTSKWIKDPGSPQTQSIFGYAGSGKTTLARELASGIDGNVLFAAYTGKAANVLQSKGCNDATTIHSLIYHSREQSAARLKELEAKLAQLKMELNAKLGPENQDILNSDPAVLELAAQIDLERQQVSKPSFQLNYDSPVKYAKLVVIDECSMVNAEMAEDLLFFGTKILVLGDPFQLPPVMGGGYFTNVTPNIMLREIHRQARDNPIIDLATRVRNRETLPLGSYGNSTVLTKDELRERPELVREADQVLVGRNLTRQDYNRRLRQLRHGEQSWVPVPRDRLVCLRNNRELGLFNGSTWKVGTVLSHDSDRVIMSVISDTGEQITVEAHGHYFQGNKNKMAFFEAKEAEEFDYGYALTVHKSQGSQWGNVALFDESYCFRKDSDKDMPFKWQYTGITRAADRITFVNM